jgi:hypothetical protein
MVSSRSFPVFTIGQAMDKSKSQRMVPPVVTTTIAFPSFYIELRHLEPPSGF